MVESSPHAERPLIRALQLFALFSIAVAQPLLDLVARHAPFLVAHRAGPAEIELLLAALLVGPPACAWLLEEVAHRIRGGLGSALHLAFVGLLAGATALPLLERAGAGSGAAPIAIGLALGALAALAFARLRLVRLFATALAFAPFVFAASFATHPSISKLLFAQRAEGAEPVAIEAETPVVVVILDELPTTSLLDENGRIDALRYPAFARLAADAIWFRNASGVHGLTEHALPAILTGRYPQPGLLPTASDHPRNLFTLLGGHYAMHVVEPFTALFASRDALHREPGEGLARLRALLSDLSVVYLHVLLPKDLAAALPGVTRTWRDFARAAPTEAADDRAEAFTDRPGQFRAFTASIEPSAKPTLHFLHTPLPHVPWQYLPSGRAYYPPIDFDFWDNVWGEEEWWVVQGYQRHLLQLGLVDRLLGELLASLKRRDLYDRSLLVVAADHGASFRPAQSRRDPANMDHPEDVLGVPLFVKPANQREGRVSLRNVETIDILPTIADLLGIEIPWPIDGCSAVDPSCPPRERKVMYDRNDVRLSFDPELPLRLDSLERKLEIFGSGSRPNGLFTIGPRRDLVGQRVEQIGVRGPGDARVQLMRAAFDRANQRPETFALGRITGILDRNPTGGETPHLAIAVEGTVHAVAPAFRRPQGDYLFSAMLPQRAYAFAGARVEVFAVETSPTGPALLRLPVQLATLQKVRAR